MSDLRSHRLANALTVDQAIEYSSYWELVKNEIYII